MRREGNNTVQHRGTKKGEESDEEQKVLTRTKEFVNKQLKKKEYSGRRFYILSTKVQELQSQIHHLS